MPAVAEVIGHVVMDVIAMLVPKSRTAGARSTAPESATAEVAVKSPASNPTGPDVGRAVCSSDG